MPVMDGLEATKRILELVNPRPALDLLSRSRNLLMNDENNNEGI